MKTVVLLYIQFCSKSQSFYVYLGLISPCSPTVCLIGTNEKRLIPSSDRILHSEDIFFVFVFTFSPTTLQDWLSSKRNKRLSFVQTGFLSAILTSLCVVLGAEGQGS